MTIKPPVLKPLRHSSDRDVSPARRPRVLLALLVRVFSFDLDRRLADGEPAGEREDLALRSRQLADPSTRCKVARAVRQTVADAERTHSPGFSSTVPTRRDAVVRSREAMLGLAERLECAEPMSPRAVARVLVLLRDGTGPLYNAACGDSLDDAVWAVADATSQDLDAADAFLHAALTPED